MVLGVRVPPPVLANHAQRARSTRGPVVLAGEAGQIGFGDPGGREPASTAVLNCPPGRARVSTCGIRIARMQSRTRVRGRNNVRHPREREDPESQRVDGRIAVRLIGRICGGREHLHAAVAIHWLPACAGMTTGTGADTDAVRSTDVVDAACVRAREEWRRPGRTLPRP